MRRPRFDSFDAEVDLGTDRRDADWAYVVVKRSYRIGADGGLTAAAAQPLQGDPRGKLEEIPAQSDFWASKRGTDVVVNGSAGKVDGRAFVEHEVSLSVGPMRRRIAVFGDRRVRWRKGRPRIGAIDAVTEVPLTPAFAYGGVDLRVPLAAPGERYPNLVAATVAAVLHPGRYPRNPFGEGYLCVADASNEAPLPNLEDPADLLDDERLVADRHAWWRQPRPAYFAFQHPLMFPRVAQFGADAANLPNDLSALPEVQDGSLDPAALRPLMMDPMRARHEAAPQLALPVLEADTPIVLDGCSAERPTLSFRLPAAPAIDIELDGDREPVAVSMTVVRLYPDDQRVDVVYRALREDLPKRFIRGIHAAIPLSATVDGHRLAYTPPPTWDRSADPFSASHQHE